MFSIRLEHLPSNASVLSKIVSICPAFIVSKVPVKPSSSPRRPPLSDRSGRSYLAVKYCFFDQRCLKRLSTGLRRRPFQNWPAACERSGMSSSAVSKKSYKVSLFYVGKPVCGIILE